MTKPARPTLMQLRRHFTVAASPKGVVVTISGPLDEAAASVDKVRIPLGVSCPIRPGPHMLYWRAIGRPGTPFTVAIGGDASWSRELVVPGSGEALGFKGFDVP